ncbi:hypothetical protein [Vibrio parahaemolyticus]|uniref:hypothetical protein n=1 Tax=Vibrio parahaemolyticus TaxID=670 RepID=UPI0004235ED1|nr:hypothetical protein [Vibrio parahaemolyticus]
MENYEIICEKKREKCAVQTDEALSDLCGKKAQLEYEFGVLLSHIWNRYELMVERIDGTDLILSGAEDIIPEVRRRDGIESMIASFSIGTTSIETLLRDGAYIQACAVLRQELEILTQIHHFSNGTYKAKKAPNVEVLEEGYRKLYGQLSKVVHLSCKQTMQNFAKGGGVNEPLLSPLLYSLSPEFNYGLCNELMALHILVFIEIISETQEYIKEIIPDIKFDCDNKLESIRESILKDFPEILE